jgi:small GTP-binding protein
MLYVRTQAAALFAYKLLDKGNVEKTQIFPSSVQAMILGERTLFCAWEDNTIRLYDLGAGSSSRVLVGHQRLAERLRYENDALISCGRGEVRIWNVQTGQCKTTIVGDQCAIPDHLGICETNNGTSVVTVSSDQTTVSTHIIRDVIRGNKLANVIATCNAQGLTEVDLSRCDIQAFPDYEFEKPTNVTILRLTSNKLSTLPASIKDFKKLKELHMNDNNFSRVPTEVCTMRYLRKLRLEKNQLFTVPPAVGRLMLLEELSLAHNQLAVIPPELGDLVNLTSLDLSFNALLTVPQTFVQLRKCATLLLNNNQFGESLEVVEPLSPRSGGGVPLSPRQDTTPPDSLPTTPRASSSTSTIPAAAYSVNGLPAMSTPSPRAGKRKGKSKGRSGNESATATDTEESGYKSDRTGDRSPRRTPQRVSSLATDPASMSPQSKPSSGSLTSREETRSIVSGRDSIDMTEQCFLHSLDFSQLSALATLHAHNNRLARFPKHITDCITLVELNFSSNHIKRFPPGIEKLKNLQRLFLSRNFITNLPDEIVEINKLEELILDDNRVRELPEKLELFNSLKKLSVCKNSLTSLPMEFGRLVELRELSLEQNTFKEFPSELTNLQSLKILSTLLHFCSIVSPHVPNLTPCVDVDRNKLVSLPTEVFYMTSLQSLSLRFNQLKRIPYQSLIHLTKLALDGNIFSELPGTVTRMRNLTELSLTRNQLNNISPDVAFCSNLVKLDLSSNNLIEVPPTLGLLPRLRTLNLSNNIALREPPRDIVEAVNTPAVMEHLVNSAYGGAKPAYESRLCFVGLEGCGKSSLVQRMKIGKFQKRAKSTKGIEIDEMISKISVRQDGKKKHVKCHFSLWDFGGCEDYLPLQTLFLNERAVYLIVWDLGLDESRSKIDFWLNTIRYHAGNAPVIIVGTHTDSVRDSQAAIAQLEKKYFTTKYPSVKYIVPVSCFSGDGIEKLMKRVAAVVQQQPYMGEQIPACFNKLAAAIVKDRSKGKVPLIELPEFQKVAAANGVEKLTFSAALHYLHDLGVVFNLTTMTYDSQGAVITDPSWMIKLMSSILGARKQFINNGVLKHEDLNTIWSDSEISQLFHLPFIAMMHRLELAFEEGAQGKKTSRNFYTLMSIFPSMLPEQVSKSSIWPRETNDPEFVKLYKLGFVPSSLMGRLMCRVFRKARPLIFWKDGFVVADTSEFDPTIPAEERKVDLIAKVEIAHKTATLKITVRGSKPLTFMRLMTDSVDNLVKRWYTFPRMQQSSYVSYTHQSADSDEISTYIFPLQHIENALKKGQSMISYNSLDVPLKTLLPDFEQRSQLETDADVEY